MKNKARDAFYELFKDADEVKRAVLQGLIEEAFDCKTEITALKAAIADQQKRGVPLKYRAGNEKLLVQKRACYTNMMGKLCKELCSVSTAADDDELEDYE